MLTRIEQRVYRAIKVRQLEKRPSTYRELGQQVGLTISGAHHCVSRH